MDFSTSLYFKSKDALLSSIKLNVLLTRHENSVSTFSFSYLRGVFN